MKTNWLGLALVVLPLAVSVPLGRNIRQERILLKYGGPHVSLAMRDRLGQGAAIGLLAGFRGVVADFLWIQNQGFWENREWIRMYRNMELVTTLQPQSTTFWDLAQWHMAWNIGYAVLTDPANRTKAEGLKRQREWLERARDFLAEGIRNVPNHSDLYFAMGTLYLRKFNDPCTAAEYFRQSAQFPDAPSYTDRMCARSLEHCGKVRAAYDYWKMMWRQHRHYVDHIDNTALVERELRRLENELKIPNKERIFPLSAAPATATTQYE